MTLTIIVLIFLFILEISIVVVVIGINTLVAETVDAAQCVTNLHTVYKLLISIVELTIHGCQYILIHFGHNIQVLSHVSTQSNIELADIQDRFRGDIEFPTFVFHLSDIGIRDI